MKPVIIFGAGTVARLAWRCFEEETPYSVAAFCVDDNRHNADTFCELPVSSIRRTRRPNWPEMRTRRSSVVRPWALA